MDKAILRSILGAAEGVTLEDGSYQVSEKHRVTFYVGQPGQAMVISDVASCSLEDHFVTIVSRETGAAVYVEYESIHALSDRPPAVETSRRAGFV